MSWQDRLREAAYTSPSGTRIVFQYEDVRRDFDKKTSSFNFPDADGTYVQDTGTTGRRYPLRVIFWGADYDTQADGFEAALAERGIGRLDHPIYGQVQVVPFGTISRRDDLVNAANQCIIEVTFWDTIDVVYPARQSQPSADVLLAVEAFNAASAGDFAATVELDTAVQQTGIKGTVQSLLDRVKSATGKIAATQDAVQRQFTAVSDSIEAGIDTLVGDPLALAFQTTILIQAPARARADIAAKLSAYRDLATGILESVGFRDGNEYKTSAVTAQGAVSGSILSAVNNEFATRREALEAADEILSQFDALIAWRDDQNAAFGVIDTGAGYQALQSAAALVSGYLVETSFSLATERSIVMTEPRTIIDLAAEIYGAVDERLDFLINTNSLTGSEILELPRGRVIRYYE